MSSRPTPSTASASYRSWNCRVGAASANRTRRVASRSAARASTEPVKRRVDRAGSAASTAASRRPTVVSATPRSTGVAGEDPIPDARPATTSSPATSNCLRATAEFDPTSPHPARVHACWLGNHKDSFAADRTAAAQIAEIAPWIVTAARAERAFLTRAVTHLAKAGLNHFLNLGTGMPAPAGNVHQIAQRINPDARVVYVASDPIVLAYARALLAGPHTIAVSGDARDPSAILADPTVRAHLDHARPIAVLLVGTLQSVRDDREAAGITATLRDSLLPGSHLVISHPADLPDRPGQARAPVTRQAARLHEDLVGPSALRTTDQITNLLQGLHLIDPGVVPIHRWRPAPRRLGPAVHILGAAGRVGTDIGVIGPPACFEINNGE